MTGYSISLLTLCCALLDKFDGLMMIVSSDKPQSMIGDGSKHVAVLHEEVWQALFLQPLEHDVPEVQELLADVLLGPVHRSVLYHPEQGVSDVLLSEVDIVDDQNP